MQPHDLWILIAYGLAVLLLVIIIAGLSNRIVFYFDHGDLALSFAPPLALVLTAVALFALGFRPENAHQALAMAKLALAGQSSTPGGPTPLAVVLVMGSGAALALGCLLFTFVNAARFNRSLALGVLVGTCKLLLSVLVVFWPLLGRASGQGSRRTTPRWAIYVLIGIFAWIIAHLVNGRAVYQRRNWPMPY
jgi:uncharacterized membrane protein YidH (DUF202 family)